MALENLTDAKSLRWFLLGQSVRRGGRKEQWETLFEGAVETKYQGLTNNNQASVDVDNAISLITEGATFRVTIDGVTHVESVRKQPSSNGNSKYDVFYVGNLWLKDCGKYGLADDDGRNVLVWTWPQTTQSMEIDTRNPGTYTVKIERKVS